MHTKSDKLWRGKKIGQNAKREMEKLSWIRYGNSFKIYIYRTRGDIRYIPNLTLAKFVWKFSRARTYTSKLRNGEEVGRDFNLHSYIFPYAFKLNKKKIHLT